MSSSGGGYYRMHRGWMDGKMFASVKRDPFDRRSAWAWLIERAAFEGEQRGQLSYSVRYLAEAWGWSATRVFDFLKSCVRHEMIACSTGTSQTTITICNYNTYQASSPTTRTPEGVPAERDPNTTRTNIKEGKEGKEKKKDISPSLRSDFLVWYANYPNKKAPQDAEKAYMRARSKASAAELLAGIERYRSGKPDYADWAHPATWLNKGRWADEYGNAAQQTRRVPTAPPPIFEVIDGDQRSSDQSIPEPGTLQFPQKTAAG